MFCETLIPERQWYCQCDNSDGVTSWSKVEWHKCKPDDNGSVVSEGYVSCFIEATRTLPCLHSICCT